MRDPTRIDPIQSTSGVCNQLKLCAGRSGDCIATWKKFKWDPHILAVLAGADLSIYAPTLIIMHFAPTERHYSSVEFDVYI